MPLATNSEFEEAVKAAKDAFPAWKRTPVPHRQRVMLKLQQLIRENMVRKQALYFASMAAHYEVLRFHFGVSKFRFEESIKLTR